MRRLAAFTFVIFAIVPLSACGSDEPEPMTGSDWECVLESDCDGEWDEG